MEDEQAITDARDELFSTGGTRRRLRNPQNERLLAYKCQAWCMGWPRGHCVVWKPQCRGYRRRMEEITSPENVDKVKNVRQLQITSPECQSKITEAFVAMQLAVSADAEPVIQSTTNFLCYDECQITGFALWNANCDVVTRHKIVNGTLICRQDYEFSIEAITDDCVDSVNFKLTKDSVSVFGRVERNAPYTLFGNRKSDIDGPSAVGLQNMATGTYLLTATPDNDPSLSTTISFTLMDC